MIIPAQPGWRIEWDDGQTDPNDSSASSVVIAWSIDLDGIVQRVNPVTIDGVENPRSSQLRYEP